MILLGAAYTSVKRALAHDQQRGPRSPLPLWRLLLGEIALIGRRIGHWKVTMVVVVVFASVLVVETLLTPVTPGPTADQPWRTLVAVFVAGAALFAWAVLHAHRRTVHLDLRDPDTGPVASTTDAPVVSSER